MIHPADDLQPRRGALVFTEAEVRSLAALVEEHSGIQIAASRSAALVGRIEPVARGLGLASAREILGALRIGGTSAERIVNALTIGESYFFRNHPHFDALRDEVLPRLHAALEAKRELKIWSAACACGEEPYSLAMLLEEDPRFAGWEISILATDLNTEFLGRAREAIYPPWAFRGVDAATIARHFEDLPGGRRRLAPRIQRRVRFEAGNLAKPGIGARLPVPGPFDLVFCRNVLIYFSYELADAVVREISTLLSPIGHLFVGHAEVFPGLDELEAVYAHGTFYYRQSPDSPGRRSSIPPARGGRISFAAPPLPPSRRSRILGAGAFEAAQAAMTAGDLAGAIAVIERSTQSGQSGPGGQSIDDRLYLLGAVIADARHEHHQALEYLRRLLFLRRDLPFGHYLTAIQHERLDDALQAQRAYRNLLTLLEGRPDDEPVEGSHELTAGRMREIAESRRVELMLLKESPR